MRLADYYEHLDRIKQHESSKTSPTINKSAQDWWKNTPQLLNLKNKDIEYVFKSALHGELSLYYEQILKSMSWEERLYCLETSIGNLRISPNEKYRKLSLIHDVATIAKDVLPIILTILRMVK